MNKALQETLSLLLAFGERYGPQAGEEGPVRLVREVFGVELDPWQEKLLRAFGRGERLISVASCHGPGKTAVAALCCLTHLLTRFPQKTVVTAPSSSTLDDGLFVEILKWMDKLPPALKDLFEVTKERIVLKAAPAESFLSARTSRAEKPEALQGVHCAPGYVLMVADEASGIPEAVYAAAAGSMSGENATMLLIGNPTRTSGLFYDTHHSLKDDWFTLTVGYTDSSRVSAQFVEQIAKQHGEDSNEFRIRCLGLFPTSDDDVVIPRGALDKARGRDIQEAENAPRVWGLDVARFGGDRNALAIRTPRALESIESWTGLDLMETAGKVVHKYRSTPPHERPVAILVDVIGLGAGVLDRLRELGLPARGVNVSETASSNEKFYRLRDELWWTAREWLEGNDVKIPPQDPDKDPRQDPLELMIMELTLPTYTYSSDGRIQVEPKHQTKKRVRRSPDHGDAFVLTFAEDAVSLARGRAMSTSWNEPIKRGVAIF